ncbi:hypothetical protein [Bifidobacterium aquikefiricola]|uniref:Uncharacterized protein n=1 Tax=Bifidobacterium aquikefiricola TaxID=3059038 RepID=A0AB39U7C9_9BIFI
MEEGFAAMSENLAAVNGMVVLTLQALPHNHEDIQLSAVAGR